MLHLNTQLRNKFCDANSSKKIYRDTSGELVYVKNVILESKLCTCILEVSVSNLCQVNRFSDRISMAFFVILRQIPR